jgi:hypothetical protein
LRVIISPIFLLKELRAILSEFAELNYTLEEGFSQPYRYERLFLFTRISFTVCSLDKRGNKLSEILLQDALYLAISSLLVGNL